MASTMRMSLRHTSRIWRHESAGGGMASTMRMSLRHTRRYFDHSQKSKHKGTAVTCSSAMYVSLGPVMACLVDAVGADVASCSHLRFITS